MDPTPRKTSLNTFFDVRIGGARSAGITPTGVVQFWGDELMSKPTQVLSPTPVDGVPQAQLISVGSGYGCAYIPGGSVYCWADNSCNQLGGMFPGTYSTMAVKIF
jgi:hypothetical protein